MSNIENEQHGSTARSPVIDLEAEEISPGADAGDSAAAKDAESAPPAAETTAEPETAAPEPPKEEPVSPPPPREKSPLWTKTRVMGIAAVIAAFLGAWFYREFGAQWWPPSAMTAMEEKLGALEASNRTLNEQLVALSTALDTFRSTTTESLDTQAKAAGGVDGRLAELEKALGELRQSVASLGSGTTTTSPDPAALADITQRIERLEQQVADLSKGTTTTTPPPTGTDDFTELTQALSDLKAKFQAGVAYKEELDRIAIYVPGNSDLADLVPFAASGIANPQALGDALEALVPNLGGSTSGETATAEAGGFWAWFGTVVKIRDLNTLDWADLAKSAAADARAGDLKAAIARLEEPGGDLPSGLADWRDKARQRLKAEGAMAQLAAAVTQIIMGKP
jgi:hypothetical protein